ncbi:arylformamidase [Polycladomyces subterraneus]|uniref:Kynurenine formamidase n=1 Tax=Polycladomyces subterraneus TaxID=1016997 RepID=A0ABT8IPT6_9BACL|nr:arylformamidase [Polycladomyces subterraneus]MDN4594541.1 arylformamidase [Polycladomyces subterraneus]
MKWLDISQPLSNDIAVWPGDTPFSFALSWTMEHGSVNVGKLTMSTHTGTHVDAPFHFDDTGHKVMELDIEVFVGPARVIDVSPHASVGAEELAAYDLEGVKRLLLRTRSASDPTVFPATITYMRPDAADYLHEKGVRLLGVDVPSVDPLDSKELAAHHELLKCGIYILENVVLDQVRPGDYELIAVPLALQDADASPVRALLRPYE